MMTKKESIDEEAHEVVDYGFPVKGTGVRAMLRFVREIAGNDGINRLLEALPAEHKEALAGTVTATSKFRETTNQALINGIVQVFLDNDPERAVEIGRYLIDDGLNVVYRTFLRVGNPGWLVSKVDILWKMYHEVGRLEAIDIQEHSAHARLEFPHLDTAFCRVITGCILRGLELVGSKNPKLVHETCIKRGDPVCNYRITW